MKKRVHNKSTGRDYTSDHAYNKKTIKERSERNQARAEMLAYLTKKYGRAEALRRMKDKDVDHKKELRHGGTNDLANLRLVPKGKNRSRRDHKVTRRK